MSIDRVNISSRRINRSQPVPRNEPIRKPEQNRPRASAVAAALHAEEINRLANSVEQARAERLNEVARALESGTYHVSAKDLAEKLIAANRR